MKVTFGKDYKKFLTVEQHETAKTMIRNMKEDESSPADYAVYAVNAIGRAEGMGSCEKVMECTAEIAGNCRIYNYYGENTGVLDVWLSGTAKTWRGFIEFGAYLSDVWGLSYDTEADTARSHMYYKIYKEA